MICFPWISKTSGKATLEAQPQSSMSRALRMEPRVPADYQTLKIYLERRYALLVVLSFEQIESLLGFPLPPAARSEATWWTSENDSTRHTTAWTTARRSAMPNLLARTVAFERLP